MGGGVVEIMGGMEWVEMGEVTRTGLDKLGEGGGGVMETATREECEEAGGGVENP